MRQFLALACVLLAFAGCESAVAPGGANSASAASRQTASSPVRPLPPVLEAEAPAYPALAIYIVFREYVHLNPGTTTLRQDDPRYQQYVERRLRELYPERGHAGMMREAVAEARRNRDRVQQYERDLRNYERQMVGYSTFDTGSLLTASTCGATPDPNEGADASWTGQQEFLVPPDEQIPTIQMEIDTLQLAGKEVDDIYYYESLATGTYAGGGGGGSEPPISMTGVEGEPTRDDLIRAAAAGGAPDEITTQLAPGAIALVALGVVGGWKYYRVQQAEDRAHRKSSEFYPSMGEADTRRDAHRHIYVNMMLRRYVGATAAKIIMDRHESGSAGGAKVMDLHNNDIGRSHRYNAFRGHWFWDRWDWGEWAAKVRSYINDPANAEHIPEWYGGTETTDEAWVREACVPDAKYIYFAP